MGCFSYICKECNEPILSNSFTGQSVKLTLLKDGNVVQEMTGKYDSYGRVFIEGTQNPAVEHDLRESVQWDDPTPEIGPTENEQYFLDKGDEPDFWGRVCSLMWAADTSNGIAAVHTRCQVEGKVPTTRSKDDPNQGWGEDLELLADGDANAELG